MQIALRRWRPRSSVNSSARCVPITRASCLGRKGNVSSANRIRQLREHFGLTQTELAHVLGVSLRTVQNWERAGVAGRPRQLRDLEELWTILKESIQDSDIPA